MCFGTGPRQEYYGEEIVATRPSKAAHHSHNHSHDSQQQQQQHHHHSHNSHNHHHHHSTSKSPTPRASYHGSSRQVQYGPSPRASTTVYRTSGPVVYETTTTRTRAT